jgi:hypothetical protein
VKAKAATSTQAIAKGRAVSSTKTQPLKGRTDQARSTVTDTAASGTSSPAMAPAATAARGMPITPAATGGREFDFGGTLITGQARAVQIGEFKAKPTFALMSSAHANLPNGLGSCQSDRPRVAHGVKSLANNGAPPTRNTAEYMPGMYNTSWVGMAGNHLVALNRVAVLRDGGAPAHAPELLVYDNYKGNTAVKADYRKTPEVNTYLGDKALLYRVFVDGPVQCLDIVIPNDNPREAPQSNLVYAYAGQMYQTKFAPVLAK